MGISGTMGVDDSVKVEGTKPVISSERNQNDRPSVKMVFEGIATGSKTLFNKTASIIEVNFYFNDDPTDPIDFEATR